MKKKRKCYVCGAGIALRKELVYRVREAILPLAEAFTRTPAVFDAMDCPVWGCQQVLATRMPKLDFTVIDERKE